jgi:hypothetical protein
MIERAVAWHPTTGRVSGMPKASTFANLVLPEGISLPKAVSPAEAGV